MTVFLTEDYTAWMNQSSQATFDRLKVSQRGEWTKKRFRNFILKGQRFKGEWFRTRFPNFLFKMCGCYELVLFWLRVPASSMSLRIFKEVFVDGEEETTIKMNRAVQAVRDWLGVEE